VIDLKVPDVTSYFMYQGMRYEVEWFDVDTKTGLEGISWQQVYAIGDVKGKVPVVEYEDPLHESLNLPGGKTELGEKVEQTLIREMEEELNMRLLSWYPLGYQKVTTPSGETVNQLRVYAKLEPIGPFISDPGGSVIGHRLVQLQEVNGIIGYGDVGERLVARASKLFSVD
jgi:hypothetical protein